jgi:hypothetical protein
MLLGCKANKVIRPASNASKNRAQSIQQSNGHANIRSQKSHIGHLRVHQYRHH